MAVIERTMLSGPPLIEEIPEVDTIPSSAGDDTVVVNAGSSSWVNVSFSHFNIDVAQGQQGEEGIDRCVIKWRAGTGPVEKSSFANVSFPQGYIFGAVDHFCFGKPHDYPRPLIPGMSKGGRKDTRNAILLVDDDALVMHVGGEVELCRGVGTNAHPHLSPNERVVVAAGAHSFTVMPGMIRHHCEPSLG